LVVHFDPPLDLLHVADFHAETGLLDAAVLEEQFLVALTAQCFESSRIVFAVIAFSA